METDYYRKVIKKYRKENKLSQEKLAELLGYDTTYMSHIETGKREPSVDFFIKFSNLSGISFDYLFCCETQIGTQIKLNELSNRMMKLLPKDRHAFTFDNFIEYSLRHIVNLLLNILDFKIRSVP